MPPPGAPPGPGFYGTPSYSSIQTAATGGVAFAGVRAVEGVLARLTEGFTALNDITLSTAKAEREFYNALVPGAKAIASFIEAASGANRALQTLSFQQGKRLAGQAAIHGIVMQLDPEEAANQNAQYNAQASMRTLQFTLGSERRTFDRSTYTGQVGQERYDPVRAAELAEVGAINRAGAARSQATYTAGRLPQAQRDYEIAVQRTEGQAAWLQRARNNRGERPPGWDFSWGAIATGGFYRQNWGRSPTSSGEILLGTQGLDFATRAQLNASERQQALVMANNAAQIEAVNSANAARGAGVNTLQARLGAAQNVEGSMRGYAERAGSLNNVERARATHLAQAIQSRGSLDGFSDEAISFAEQIAPALIRRLRTNRGEAFAQSAAGQSLGDDTSDFADGASISGASTRVDNFKRQLEIAMAENEAMFTGALATTFASGLQGLTDAILKAIRDVQADFNAKFANAAANHG